MYRRSLLIGVLLAGMLAAPVPVQGSEWVFFEACGFTLVEGDIPESSPKKRAPNINGYWVRHQYVIGLVDWKPSAPNEGIQCTSLYVFGCDHPVQVVGTVEEVLEKLRHE